MTLPPKRKPVKGKVSGKSAGNTTKPKGKVPVRGGAKGRKRGGGGGGSF